MIISEDYLTKEEIEYYDLLEKLRCMSSCSDKQVAALATNDMGKIISVSYNQPTECCDSCASSEHPKNCAIHAEQGLILQPGCFVYLTTFPCEACQMFMFSAGVRRVYVFGDQHKKDTGLLDITLLPDIASTLVKFNGIDKQKNVIMGELAELITAIADSMRKDPKDTRDIEDELIDVELQLQCLRRCIKPIYLGKYTKYIRLVQKYNKE